MTYPNWQQVDDSRWESAETTNGTPDFVATKEPDGWRLKARSSPMGTRGFPGMDEVRAHVQKVWGDVR